MTTAAVPPAPVVRLRTPAETVAVVPSLCGFVPHESLVVLSLRGPRSRLGLTMRIDLPAPADEPALAEQVGGRLRVDGARSAVLVVHTEEPDGRHGLPRRRLVDAAVRALRAARVEPLELLLVRAGRWWSYSCSATCCPPEGTPVDPAAPAAGLLAAQAVLDGRAVLPSRAALVSSLEVPSDPALRARLLDAAAARERRVRVEGRVPVGRSALRLWRRALTEAPEVRDLPPATSAHLVVSLQDVLVRDEVLTWALEDDAGLLALLLRLASVSTPPHDAAVCALVAWVAHLRGDGALANVALDRALASDPRYAMAGMCRQALDAQVRPQAVRDLLADARALLHSQHPWTAPPVPSGG